MELACAAVVTERSCRHGGPGSMGGRSHHPGRLCRGATSRCLREHRGPKRAPGKLISVFTTVSKILFPYLIIIDSYLWFTTPRRLFLAS